MAISLRLNWLCLYICVMVVSNKTFKSTNSNWLELYAKSTLTLTLAFLRTDTTTYSRKRRRKSNCLISSFKIFILNMSNKLRNTNIYRTTLNTWTCLTIKTSLSFINSCLNIITKSNLIEVMSSYLWCLCWHLMFFWINRHTLLSSSFLKKIACFFISMVFEVRVHSSSTHGLIKIDLVSIKVWSINTCKLSYLLTVFI